jgi:hypothetical protein
MPTERRVRRYTAYFPGWATAFGAHEKDAEDPRGLIWLYGEGQLGLLLNPELREFLYPLFLGNSHEETPVLALSEGWLRIAEVELAIGDSDLRPFTALMGLLEEAGDLHLSQTYHLVYPSGTRILTLGRKAPLALVYREIAPLRVQLP